MTSPRAPWGAILDVPDVIDVTRSEMVRSGGGTPFNASEVECVQARFGTAWTSECYVADSDKIEGYTFACALLVNLSRAHCLTDGNKRLAWISFTMALARLGFGLEASTDEAEQFCIRIIVEGLDHGVVAAWASDRIIELEL